MTSNPTDINAPQFIERLATYLSPEQATKYRDALVQGEGDISVAVAMGQVFALAKEFIDLPLGEIEALLESRIHEVRVGAVSIMDFQARRKKTSGEHRRELYELYLRRHDRINNWDLVDRAAPYVVGGYLSDKPRDALYELAHSGNVWERRTAIVSTYYFIRQNDVADSFNIAELLLGDDHHLIQTAVGGWLREAGKKDLPRLLSFLDQHAATMSRVALRYATEHLEKPKREHYLNLEKIQNKRTTKERGL